MFQKIGIVGLGLIGGSIALAARQLWPTSLVLGVDRADVLEIAMRRHAIDVGAADPVVLAEADVVILAAPVLQNVDLLARLDRSRLTRLVAAHLSERTNHPDLVAQCLESTLDGTRWEIARQDAVVPWFKVG